MSAGASEAVDSFCESLKQVKTDQLNQLAFAVGAMVKMPHHIWGSDRMDQKTIEARIVRFLIQDELERRGEGGWLPYDWEEMFNAMGVKGDYPGSLP